MSKQENFQEHAEKYANKCGGTTQEKCAIMTDYFAGAEYGYQYALQHPQWIPVKEELPEPQFADTSSDWVLVCTTKGDIFIDSYNHKHNEWCNNRTSVTHWMPIVPPKEE